MSWSLPIRALEAFRRKSTSHLFQESLHNILASHVPLSRTQQALHELELNPPSVASIEARLQEVAAVDLSPTGLMLSQIRSGAGIAEMVRAYNTHVDVIDPMQWEGQRLKPTQAVSKTHLSLVEALGPFLLNTQHRNTRHPGLPSPQRAFTVGDMARILNATSLVRDACDFFIAHPQAKVADLYNGLGLQARTAERRSAAEGLAAIKIKRACAISSASRFILWSDLSLADIALRFGYSDAAHLHHEFKRSTGGIPPSVYRQAGRLVH
jgi:AraC-like DNA-binding protein